jgi:hypothetical protein
MKLGEIFRCRFDACCLRTRLCGLGPLIPPIEYEGVVEEETRLRGMIQAYRHYLEKHVERTALANLLKISSAFGRLSSRDPSETGGDFCGSCTSAVASSRRSAGKAPRKRVRVWPILLHG